MPSGVLAAGTYTGGLTASFTATGSFAAATTSSTLIIAPTYSFTLLTSFTGTTGTVPGTDPYYGSLIQARDGNLYGTTYRGGANNYGTVFKISSTGIVTLLHTFSFATTDGANPYAGLVQGSDGTFYGTTYQGGANNYGSVFKITSAGVFTLLHSFFTATTDGKYPQAGLVQGSDGSFYGTTLDGGPGTRSKTPTAPRSRPAPPSTPAPRPTGPAPSPAPPPPRTPPSPPPPPPVRESNRHIHLPAMFNSPQAKSTRLSRSTVPRDSKRFLVLPSPTRSTQVGQNSSLQSTTRQSRLQKPTGSSSAIPY